MNKGVERMAGKKSGGGKSKGFNHRNSESGQYTTAAKAAKKPKEHEKEKR